MTNIKNKLDIVPGSIGSLFNKKHGVVLLPKDQNFKWILFMRDVSTLELRLCVNKQTDDYKDSNILFNDNNSLKTFQGIIEQFGHMYTPAELIYYIITYLDANFRAITDGQAMYTLLQRYRKPNEVSS